MKSHFSKTNALFKDADPHAVSNFVKNNIGDHSIEIFSPQTKSTLIHKRFGALSLSEIMYGGKVLVKSPGLSQNYHLQIVKEGACTVKYDKEELVLTPGAATLINPTQAVTLNYTPDCVKLILKLPSVLFRRCSNENYGYTPIDGIGFDRRIVKLDLDATFTRLIDLVYAEADYTETENHPASSPMALLVATKALEIFPNNIKIIDIPSEDREFFEIIDRIIEKNIRKDISADDLAIACNMSLRTLYSRFSKTIKTTPSNYIKKCKLQRVYGHIQSELRSVRNVTEVALQYGFAHLGRFASDYRELFGEYPSETIRKKLFEPPRG